MKSNNELSKLKGNAINTALPNVQKVEKTLVCSCCNKNFEEANAAKCYVNYGGSVRKLMYCSTDCRDLAISINPERMSKMKSKIKSIMLW